MIRQANYTDPEEKTTVFNPYIRKEALLALKANYPDRDIAGQRIAETLSDFYQRNYPQIVASQEAKPEEAIRTVQSTARQSRMIALRATNHWLWTSKIRRFSRNSE